MKSYLLFSALFLSVFVSCTKESGYSKNVDEFVIQLIDGECDSYKSLPRFNSNDIPALLDYANDFQEINCFPVSAVSSFLPPRYILGECLLCTIELIKSYNEDENLNLFLWVPMLVKDEFGEDSESGMLDTNELLEVYNLYKDWWMENSEDKEFEDFRDIDVLKDTKYHWR